MYLKGSSLNLNKRHRKKPNTFRILLLAGMAAFLIYANQVLVPEIDPLFIPTPTPTRQPESFLSEAQDYLQQGKLVQAIPVFEQAIQSDPQNANTHLLLARLQVLTGDYEGAIQNAQDALLLSENNAMAYAVHGWALGLSGKYLEGESSVRKAIEIPSPAHTRTPQRKEHRGRSEKRWVNYVACPLEDASCQVPDSVAGGGREVAHPRGLLGSLHPGHILCWEVSFGCWLAEICRLWARIFVRFHCTV